ncbi:hypothetical protein, partial [Shinella sumterensis]|uniref:hypothetical protein n=1 Tax=Shinella sumterensis TaxID=1967501 RepID=UPI003F84D68E
PKTQKSRLEFSGRLVVSITHDWSRPPQRAHHQPAMMFMLVMAGIVSDSRGFAQEPESVGKEKGRSTPPFSLSFI